MVTALSGLAVAELVGALLRVRVSPVLAVGEAVIELTPGALAERAIDAVGRADKPLLIAGVTLGLLAVSVLAALLWRRHPVLGPAVLLAAMVASAVAAVSRPAASPWDALPSTVAGVVGLFVLGALMQRAPAESSQPAQPVVEGSTSRDRSRRRFLGSAAAVVGVAAVTAAAGRWAAGARSGAEQGRRALRLPVTSTRTPPGVTVLPAIPPWRTPNETFYRIDTALAVPLVDPRQWRLRIHGMVERELELTYEELLARGLVDSWTTLCCVSNPVGGELVGNARWSGVRTDDLLAEVGVSPDADAVLSTSADGWTCGTPLAALTDGRDALLAVAMNGEPLPLEHGFPVRMVVPGLYGYVSATKWVVDWEVTRFDRFNAYWTDRGWAERGPVKTQSRIDVPADGAGVAPGAVAVGGVAYAQHRGIERVELRVDDGAWSPAQLGAVPSPDTWVQWAYEWDAAPGEHRLTVRATDRTGATQAETEADPVPDGAQGWHTITVQVG